MENLEKLMEQPVLCKVTMDGATHESDDFVAVLSRENGDASIFYNTDALTLGMSMRLVARAFVSAMAQLSEEDREAIREVLDGSPIEER